MLAGVGHSDARAATAYEADDMLATLARATKLAGECYLVTGDKDCRQLITDRVKIYNIRKNQMYDAAALTADWGVRPDQVVDFQALVGDTVDNVPGVPLIGPKIAGELLQKYDTLENLLAPADECPKASAKRTCIDRASRRCSAASWCGSIATRAGRRSTGKRAAWTASISEASSSCSTSSGFHPRRRSIAALPRVPRSAGNLGRRLPAGRHARAAGVAGQSELADSKRISRSTPKPRTSQPRWAEIVGYSFAWKPARPITCRSGPAGEPRSIRGRRSTHCSRFSRTRRSKRSART